MFSKPKLAVMNMLIWISKFRDGFRKRQDRRLPSLLRNKSRKMYNNNKNCNNNNDNTWWYVRIYCDTTIILEPFLDRFTLLSYYKDFREYEWMHPICFFFYELLWQNDLMNINRALYSFQQHVQNSPQRENFNANYYEELQING